MHGRPLAAPFRDVTQWAVGGPART